MIWLTILAMTVIVFASRYFFLAPKLPLKLNPQTQKLLSYSSPAVLTAIWAPIVFLPNGKLAITWHNQYLIAALVAALIAWRLNNVLLSAIISMTVFFLLTFY